MFERDTDPQGEEEKLMVQGHPQGDALEHRNSLELCHSKQSRPDPLQALRIVSLGFLNVSTGCPNSFCGDCH